jgi:hypothetical protein
MEKMPGSNFVKKNNLRGRFKIVIKPRSSLHNYGSSLNLIHSRRRRKVLRMLACKKYLEVIC